ncbi:YqiJ family protein [Cognatiyoonia sp. IB215446]|uniref:YqiJ family protein n=1 Tax=Cognatiyoonia sp. IB215446 TaxID=3097355 RepID=UPI002A0AF9AF|nr:YqiJ family protein [Cognatiyoonia sp. IB215446]MDX8348667.1 YqiJ family protein [Cognatiyoonia sp. IB215446]
MLTTFLTPEAAPFSIALSVVAGLFMLEIIALILGGSVLAAGSDAPDVDIDMDADFDVDLDAEFDVDAEMDVEIDAPDTDIAPSGMLGWLGLKDAPFMIWLVSFLTIFGLSGLVILQAGTALTGLALPLIATVPAATLISAYCTRFIAAVVAAIMPKTESTAMRTRFLGGHHGVITQGTARRGRPAEAKIKDRHGNIHYLRVEPLEDDVEIPQGRDVHVIRKRDGMFFVVDITP